MSLQTAWAAIRHRPGQALALAGLSALVTACVALAPLRPGEPLSSATVGLAATDLVVEPGELLAVIGPSGAGKTTLLWLLAGAAPPTAGRVLAGGQPVDSRETALRLGIGLIPQGNGLASILTAFENVVLPLHAEQPAPRADRGPAHRDPAHRDPAHRDPADRDPADRDPADRDPADRARAALESVGLAGAGSQLVEELSGGQQQRVAVALASRRHTPCSLPTSPRASSTTATVRSSSTCSGRGRMPAAPSCSPPTTLRPPSGQTGSCDSMPGGGPAGSLEA